MAVISFNNSTSFTPSCPSLPGSAKAITAADADTYNRAVMVFCGGAGTVTCTPANGSTDVVFTVPAGAMLPIKVIAIKATGTTATGLVAVY